MMDFTKRDLTTIKCTIRILSTLRNHFPDDELTPDLPQLITRLKWLKLTLEVRDQTPVIQLNLNEPSLN